MSVALSGRFEGPVAFIDDEIRREGSDASALREEIEGAGLPILEYLDLPAVDALRHWRSLAFVILDWDFESAALGSGVSLGETGAEGEEHRVTKFLAAVLETVYCPIFLISAQRPETIRTAIVDSGLISDAELDTRMTILHKSAVLEDVFQPLEAWIQSCSGYELLRTWEGAYDEAKNRMFQDLHQLHPSWPHAFWIAAQNDGVDPSYELVNTLTSNLLNRIDVLAFDEPVVGDIPDDGRGSSLRRVLHGRSVLLAPGLYERVIMPGDLFGDTEGGPEPEVVWINLSPACHTIARGDDSEPDKVLLYLVKAERVDVPASSGAYEKLDSKNKSPNMAVLHALAGDSPYVVSFKDPRIATWGDCKAERFGRILPPYITKLQQMNSMFMQVQGLPTITKAFYDL